jgi:DNA-directed RNA polymerase subunit beta'
MPKVGDSIGLLASSTVGEPITQMALSAKHTAGMSTGKKSYSGLGTIIQFTQSPEAFKDRGAVSELDGKVTSVEEAPQGGMFVTVGDKKHYVLPGHEVYVKPGDTVEAGDQLAEGLIDPEDIVRLKGLGEGQLYYSERLHQMLQDSGAGTDRRNTEVLARGAIRHIKITDPDGMGSYLPDDVVDYNAVQKTYKVPETAKEMSPKEAIGKYLQKPYLHYTVGTRVTPTVAKKLSKNKYDSLIVDDRAPGFEPHMIRLRTASHTNPDWMASLATSSIAKQLNEGATRGDDTNIVSNPDFRPRLAVGENFGKNVSSTGEF